MYKRQAIHTAFGNIFGPGSPIAEADFSVALEIYSVIPAAAANKKPTIVFPVIFFIFILLKIRTLTDQS